MVHLFFFFFFWIKDSTGRDFFLAEVISSEEKGSGWFCATTKVGRGWMWDLGHAGLSCYVEVMLNEKVWVKSFSDNFSYT